MNAATQKLLELANRYPSPHNGQPIRLRFKDVDTIEVYFDKNRGLQAVDISFIFSFVSMGVFIEHFKRCAEALGHGIQITLELPEEAALRGDGTVKLATCSLAWGVKKPDERLIAIIKRRQTSRKKYFQSVDGATAEHITGIAQDSGMQLIRLPADKARKAAWLNQRAVFDDMFDEPVRKELNHWLRYSKKEKEAQQDGLAYDCMELNGRAMRLIVNHPGILHAPGIATILKKYYLRTMADSSDVFYMLAPFRTELQAYRIGEVIAQIWLDITAAGYYLHPFGTVMSNHEAHKDFLNLAGIQHESREEAYLVFIFRAGKSDPPTPSLRIDYQKHLIME